MSLLMKDNLLPCPLSLSSSSSLSLLFSLVLLHHRPFPLPPSSLQVWSFTWGWWSGHLYGAAWLTGLADGRPSSSPSPSTACLPSSPPSSRATSPSSSAAWPLVWGKETDESDGHSSSSRPRWLIDWLDRRGNAPCQRTDRNKVLVLLFKTKEPTLKYVAVCEAYCSSADILQRNVGMHLSVFYSLIPNNSICLLACKVVINALNLAASTQWSRARTVFERVRDMNAATVTLVILKWITWGFVDSGVECW